VKVVVGALVVLGGAGGAWMYLSQTRVTASAGAALDPSALEVGPSSAPAATPQASAPASRTGSPLDQPVRQGPPKAAYSDDPPVNIDESPLPATGSSDSSVTPAGNLANDPATEPGGDANRAAPAGRERSAPVTSTPVPAPGSARPAAADSSAQPAGGASAPALPSVNVDRITEAIGENARAKADSLGRKTITVKPPVFEKP
jgi:hypothetical protein